ncbi:hypothetical protein C8J55DRAFT_488293 [Lentinula edodes]|uniref:Restriction of telomere capping protein 4 C-terminal domain-containing protein n=1 Tax=Lentinula lateritia TaxID=40482 RepID=A0A9W9AJT1_9AGAR|nr:hypothetical protein C8J55DRAFT_488293 [Lentinula edodes]
MPSKSKDSSSKHSKKSIVVTTVKKQIRKQISEAREEEKTLISKPAGKIGRAGLTLQDAMRMGSCTIRYNRIHELSRPIIQKRLDITKCKRAQKSSLVDQTIAEMINKIPVLGDYAQHWPCHEIIRIFLGNHSKTQKKAYKLEAIARAMDKAGIPEKDREENGGHIQSARYGLDADAESGGELGNDEYDSEPESLHTRTSMKRVKAQVPPNPVKTKLPPAKIAKSKVATVPAQKKTFKLKMEVVGNVNAVNSRQIPERSAKGKGQAPVSALGLEDDISNATSDEYEDESESEDCEELESFQQVKTAGRNQVMDDFEISSNTQQRLDETDTLIANFDDECDGIEDSQDSKICALCQDPYPTVLPVELAKLFAKRASLIKLHGDGSSALTRLDMELCPKIRALRDVDEANDVYTNSFWFDTAMSIDFKLIPDYVINLYDDLSLLLSSQDVFQKTRSFQILLKTFSSSSAIYRAFYGKNLQTAYEFESTHFPPGLQVIFVLTEATYGPFATTIISYTLRKMFNSFNNDIVYPLSPHHVISMVLVPEVITRLMKDDLPEHTMNEDDCWALMRTSAHFGVIQNSVSEHYDEDDELSKILFYVDETFHQMEHNEPSSSKIVSAFIQTGPADSVRDTETNTRTSENLPPKGRRKKQSVEQNAGTVLTVNDFAEKLMIKLPPTQSSKRAQSIHATVEDAPPKKKRKKTPKDPKQDNFILSTPPEVVFWKTMPTTTSGIGGRPIRQIIKPTKLTYPQPQSKTKPSKSIKPPTVSQHFR